MLIYLIVVIVVCLLLLFVGFKASEHKPDAQAQEQIDEHMGDL